MEKIKWPSIDRVPWCPGGEEDIIGWTAKLQKQDVVITEKIDGDTVCMTREFLCDRNCEPLTKHKVWDNIKRVWDEHKERIPEGFYFFGEEFHAVRTIAYNRCDNDGTFFRVFAVVKDMLVMSYDDTPSIVENAGFNYVPVISRPEFDFLNYEQYNRLVASSSGHHSILGDRRSTAEGYVIRLRDEFPFVKIRANMLKWVQPDHVQHDKEYWLSRGRHAFNKAPKYHSPF